MNEKRRELTRIVDDSVKVTGLASWQQQSWRNDSSFI